MKKYQIPASVLKSIKTTHDPNQTLLNKIGKHLLNKEKHEDSLESLKHIYQQIKVNRLTQKQPNKYLSSIITIKLPPIKPNSISHALLSNTTPRTNAITINKKYSIQSNSYTSIESTQDCSFTSEKKRNAISIYYDMAHPYCHNFRPIYKKIIESNPHVFNRQKASITKLFDVTKILRSNYSYSQIL